MRTLTLLALSATVCLSQAYAESALSYVDLRAQAGTAQTDGTSLSVTLMAGDIGNQEQHVLELHPNMGLVLGLRGTVMETKAEREDTKTDLDLKLGGGAIVGGLGFKIAQQVHLELLGGYGQGVGTTTGETAWDLRDSRYKQYIAELGLYYTFSSGIQFGLIAGGSLVKVDYENMGTTVKAEVKGFDGSAALGYRF